MLKALKGFDRRLAAELKEQRAPITRGMACVIGSALLTSSTIWLVKAATQAISEKDMQTLGWVSLAVVGVFAIKYGFTRGTTYYLSLAATKLSNNLRVKLFEKLQRMPVTYFHERRTGAIQSVLTNDINVYQSAVTVVRDAIEGPVKAVSAFITILFLQWQLSLVSIVLIPIMATIIQRNGKKMRSAQAAVQQDLSDLQSLTQEAIQGQRVIKAFNAEERVNQEFRSLVDRVNTSTMRGVKTFASLRPLVELIGAVALAIVFYVCGMLAKNGTLMVSDIAALVIALDVINQGVKSIGYVNNTYNQVQAAAKRIYDDVLDMPVEHEDSPGTRQLPELRGLIEFKDVSFTYPDGTEALRGVSFVIEPGTSLALVGPSGAGKSTIADLLLRFYDPTSGSILVDGVNIRELDLTWWRGMIGVVPQQSFLFAGSIAENLRLGTPKATDEEIEVAAKAAHVEDFVSRLPQRFETVVGERGVGLSGGEIQRISIARALIRRPTMLLLDEATSNLDSVSEQVVTTALEEARVGRTTLLIAHRLTTAARADRIMVLSRGEVIETGPHTELMSKNGVYAAMYRAFGAGVMA